MQQTQESHKQYKIQITMDCLISHDLKNKIYNESKTLNRKEVKYGLYPSYEEATQEGRY